jgi:serine/threonine protein phosphatase PrpC
MLSLLVRPSPLPSHLIPAAGPFTSSFDGSEHMTQRDMEAHDTELLLQETVQGDGDLSDEDESELIELHPQLPLHIDSDEMTPLTHLESFAEQISSFLTAPGDTPESETSSPSLSLSHDDTPPVISSDPLDTMTFTCPKCGRSFVGSWSSCSQHLISRKHGVHCDYDSQHLPSCLSSHSLLPIDPHSGWCDLQGRRKYIEDAHAVVFTPRYKFFGVFDGHFGNRAANYASRHIQFLFDEMVTGKRETVIQEWNFSSSSLVQTIDASEEWRRLYLPHPQTLSVNLQNLLNALHFSFIQTNIDFLQTNSETSVSGTTATVSILFSDFILIGNLGDSRAILCCDVDGRAIQLTVDHTPYVPQEKQRILSSGGRVETNVTENEILRVNNVLAVTRSIGDPQYREVLSSEPDLLLFRRPSSFVLHEQSAEMSSSPLLSSMSRRRPGQNSCSLLSEFHSSLSSSTRDTILLPQLFLVLGSDGLWDVMSNAEVVEFICASLIVSMKAQQQTTSNGESVNQLPVDAFHSVARDLSREAYVRGSMDNIGVCVIDLTS